MRVAISGTFCSGKTSLIRSLSKRLPHYQTFDEPYALMEDEGYEFSHPPTVEDYERQLERSLEIVRQAPDDALIDRCPMDYLAFADSVDAPAGIDLDGSRSRLTEAIARIDLIVFLPIECPDRMVLPDTEDAAFRQTVDARMRSFVLDDATGLLSDSEVVEVTGSLSERVQRVAGLVRRPA